MKKSIVLMTKFSLFIYFLLFTSITISQEVKFNHDSHVEINPESYKKFIFKLQTEIKIKSFISEQEITLEDFLKINNYYIDVFFRLHYDDILLYLEHNDTQNIIQTIIDFLEKNKSELLFNLNEVSKDNKTYLAKNIFVPKENISILSSQSFCDNLDFSNKDFSNWNTYCGRTSGQLGLISSVTKYNPPSLCQSKLQHSFVTGGFDPIANTLPRTYPGGSGISLLLGDGQTSQNGASVITRTFLVDALNSKLIYRYAVVLENPSHTRNEQPFFRTRLIKPDGSYDNCADYISFAGDGLPGWEKANLNGRVFEYRKWTTVLVPLSNYIGKTVTIEISVADCHRGGHFGYAYLSFDKCGDPDKIQLICENGTYKLKAPEGGTSYLWNNGQTSQTISINQPGNYSCVIVPFGASKNCNLTYTYDYQPIKFTLNNPTSFCKSEINNIEVNISGGIPPYLLNYNANGGNNIQKIINNNPFLLQIDNSLQSPINYKISVAQNINTLTCSSSQTTSINVIDGTAPTGAQLQSFCPPATISNININGTSVKYYSSPTGGQPLPLSTLLNNGSVYYASQVQNGCESFARLPITITIINPTAPTGQNKQIFCYSATINNLVITGNNIKWYLTPSGGSPLLNNFNLSSNTTYYASQTENGCESLNRLPVLVTISNPTTPTGLNSKSFCYSATINNLVITGNNIKWYLTPNGGTPLPNNFNLLSNTTYYASQTENGCESLNRLPVFVTITNPTAPIGLNNQSFCYSATINNLVITGNNIQWYLTPNGGIPLPNNFNLSPNTTYYASQTENGCESLNRLPMLVTISNPATPSGQNNQNFCYSATINDLVIIGNNIQWYLTPNGGTPLLNNFNLSSNTTYYASQTENGCESLNRLPVLVTITNPTTPTGLINQSFCYSATINDLVIIGNNIQWYLTPNGGTPLPNNFNLSSNITYYASQTENGCESLIRLPVLVNLIVPEIPTGLSIQFFCKENTSTLNDINLNHNYNLIYFDSPINGNLLPMDYILINNQILYATSYNVENNCESIIRFPVKTMILDSDLTFYNLITIDENELNKELIINGLDQFPNNIIEIYNRYGNLVWMGTNYNNLDNTFKGMANVDSVVKKGSYLPTGTYFFISSYPNDCAKSMLRGFIHIDNKL